MTDSKTLQCIWPPEPSGGGEAGSGGQYKCTDQPPLGGARGTQPSTVTQVWQGVYTTDMMTHIKSLSGYYKLYIQTLCCYQLSGENNPSLRGRQKDTKYEELLYSPRLLCSPTRVTQKHDSSSHEQIKVHQTAKYKLSITGRFLGF